MILVIAAAVIAVCLVLNVRLFVADFRRDRLRRAWATRRRVNHRRRMRQSQQAHEARLAAITARRVNYAASVN